MALNFHRMPKSSSSNKSQLLIILKRNGFEMPLKALDEQRHTAIAEDLVTVDGIRRGLEDLKEGRSQPLDEFDTEFRARHKMPSDA